MSVFGDALAQADAAVMAVFGEKEKPVLVLDGGSEVPVDACLFQEVSRDDGEGGVLVFEHVAALHKVDFQGQQPVGKFLRVGARTFELVQQISDDGSLIEMVMQ